MDAGGSRSSTLMVNGFAAVLKRHYPKSEIRANGKCVTIRLTHGETTGSDGLGYDVVPCFHLKPDDAKAWNIYAMPDGSNGWIITNPRVDALVADALQSFTQSCIAKSSNWLNLESEHTRHGV